MSVIRNLLLVAAGKSKLLISARSIVLARTMSSKADFLINNKKYSFLNELGLRDTNFGVYDGKWKGSGRVSKNYQ